VRLALVLVFPTIGLAQVLHTSGPGLLSLPVYQVLHWLSDSLMALPLAAAAVWGGQRLASRLGYGRSTLSAILARACLIGLLFALLLVPGSALHEAADTLTHTHAALAIHAHGTAPPRPSAGLAAFLTFAAHALADAIAGLAVGLPLMLLALWSWGRLAREPRKPDAKRLVPVTLSRSRPTAKEE
jgi:hypothetical protein